MRAFMPWDTMEATLAQGGFMPPVNIAEDKDNYIIQAELPGVTRDEIKVTFNNGVLTIQGERRDEVEREERQYHRVERVYGNFERSFRLPNTVRADQIHAEFRDGVLTLTVPKAEEAKPRQISINVTDGGQTQGAGQQQRSRMTAGNGGDGGQQGNGGQGSGEEGETATWGNQESGTSSGAASGGSSRKSGSSSGSKSGR